MTSLATILWDNFVVGLYPLLFDAYERRYYLYTNYFASVMLNGLGI